MGACRLAVFGVIAACFAASAARAEVCPVPTGGHPTIQSAVGDGTCTEIELGSQTYIESVTIGRTLSVSGVSTAGSIIAGRVDIVGATTVVSLGQLTVDGSHAAVAGSLIEAVDVSGGAQLLGSNFVVVNGDGAAGLIFANGFEDGSTGAWSAVVP